MARLDMRRMAPILMAAGLLLVPGVLAAQSQNPPRNTTQTMPCPGSPMPGNMGSGMMMGQGGQMMNWQEMHEEMRALREEMAKLRAELQKRGGH